MYGIKKKNQEFIECTLKVLEREVATLVPYL